MGFNPVRSIKKAVKKISGGLKKVVDVAASVGKKAWTEFKRAWNTPLGKAIIIGAAIWAGSAFLAANATSGATAVTASTAAAPVAETAAAAGEVGGLAEANAAWGAATGAEAVGGVDALSASQAASAAAGNMSAAGLGPGSAGALTPAATPGVMGAIGKVGAAAGNFATNHPLLAYGLLQTGGSMLASANTPTQAEEYADILASTQRANDLSKFRSPYATGTKPTARFKPLQTPASAPGLLER